MKLTKWYPAHIKPVREGWYETLEDDGHMYDLNWYFDGKSWCWFLNDDKKTGKYYCGNQNRVWRGLAEKP